MSLEAGARLGPYEVLAPLGAGGMGEVYRARDTKLNRDVALKVLPAAFHLDPDRLARFQREAETLASLNHPHIAAIYGLEEADGTKALVMELVEGEDLSHRLTWGALPLDEALHFAGQIADALAAAHDHGIIHRDLKPANIQVRADGTIKILDFGLAKAVDSAAGSSGSASMSPTLSGHATHAGVILGTAAYMSPEQARGRTVDRRADIWAFGAVLYEMLTGKRAFGPSTGPGARRESSNDQGDDISDTLVSVLRDEPDWNALPASVPVGARQALRICLEKDPKRRVRDITAVRLALEGAFETPASTIPAVAPGTARGGSWQRGLAWAAAGVVAGAAAVGGAVWLRPTPPAAITHFIVTAPDDAGINAGAQLSNVAIAPNGRRIAYRSTRGKPDSPVAGVLFLRELDRPDVTFVRGTENAASGFLFSPDGESVAFFTNGDNTLKRVSVHGGPAQTICKLDSAWRGGSWGVDGTIVFATVNSKGLRRVSARGGEPEVLTKVDSATGETDHILPVVLPAGAGVVFTAWHGSIEKSRIVALSPRGTVTELIRGGSSPRIAATRHLVYVADKTLRAIRFEPSRLEVTGNSVPLVEGVIVGVSGDANYALAEDGTLVYIEGRNAAPVGQRTLVWVDRQGKQQEIKVPARAYTYARLSPDGTRVALDARDQQNDIWIFDLARETLTRLTNDPGMNRSPVWSPDGTRVAFSAEREGVPESIYWQKADGSGLAERLSIGSSLQGPADFSPDGKSLLFNSPLVSPFDIGVLSIEAPRQEKMLLNSKLFSEHNGNVSPDGRWLAYESTEAGRPEIYLAPFPDVTTSKRQVSTQGGTRALWSHDGRELFYYVAPDTIMSVPVILGPNPSLGKPAVVVKGPYAVAVNTGRHYDVSPDGKRLLLLKDVAPSTSGDRRAPQMHLVQHWDEELKRIK